MENYTNVSEVPSKVNNAIYKATGERGSSVQEIHIKLFENQQIDN